MASKKVQDREPTKRGRPRREELSPLQLRAIVALLTHPTLAAAAKSVGVSTRALQRWMTEPMFLKEYLSKLEQLQLDLWRQMINVRQEVWDRFLELVRSKDERIALRAVTWYLDRALAVPAIAERHAAAADVDP